LLEEVDRARGEVARERWLRRAVEQALGLPSVPERTSGLQGSAPASAPAEQPDAERVGLRNFAEPLPELVDRPGAIERAPRAVMLRSPRVRPDVKPFQRGG
jgi:hypothetical protein